MLDKEGTKLVNFEKFCRLNSGKNLKLNNTPTRRNFSEGPPVIPRESSADLKERLKIRRDGFRTEVPSQREAPRS